MVDKSGFPLYGVRGMFSWNNGIMDYWNTGNYAGIPL
jgi:hypothetical protein